MTEEKMKKTLLAERYEAVNSAWPGTLPPLTEREALTAARRLYRFGFALFDQKRTFKGKVRITTGRRYTWIRRGVFSVNAGRGWHHLVHDISHYVHSRATSETAHRDSHAWTERQMIDHVVRSGWLDEKLKRPERTTPAKNVKQQNYERALARLKKWESRQKRAATAVKKLRVVVRRYQRQGVTPCTA